MTQKRNSNQEYFDKINQVKLEEKPTEISDQNFFTVAKERRSVRHYDPTFIMEDHEIRDLLEVAIQAPSSSNLQPWRFLVINDQEKKQQLLPIANNQQQIVDASVVIAVLGDTEAYVNAEKIYGEVVAKGAMTQEVKDFYVNQINQHYGNLSEVDATRVAMIDGGLVSMQLMLAAKAKGLDSVPMGGFNAEKFVEAFKVPANYKPVMLIAIGKAVKAGFEKTRLPLEDIINWNSFEA